MLTRSGLTYPEVSSKVYHDSFCQLGNSVSLPWVIYYGAFYLHVVSSCSCIPVICLKLVLFLIPLQFVNLFCNQSKCILLFFSCISSLLLQIISPLHKADNKDGGGGGGGGGDDDDDDGDGGGGGGGGGGGDDDDDDDDDNNNKLPEACLSFSITPFVG